MQIMSIYFSVDINILFLLLGVCLKIIFSFLSIEQEYKGAGSETSKKINPSDRELSNTLITRNKQVEGESKHRFKDKIFHAGT